MHKTKAGNTHGGTEYNAAGLPSVLEGQLYVLMEEIDSLIAHSRWHGGETFIQVKAHLDSYWSAGEPRQQYMSLAYLDGYLGHLSAELPSLQAVLAQQEAERIENALREAHELI